MSLVHRDQLDPLDNLEIRGPLALQENLGIEETTAPQAHPAPAAFLVGMVVPDSQGPRVTMEPEVAKVQLAREVNQAQLVKRVLTVLLDRMETVVKMELLDPKVHLVLKDALDPLAFLVNLAVRVNLEKMRIIAHARGNLENCDRI